MPSFTYLTHLHTNFPFAVDQARTARFWENERTFTLRFLELFELLLNRIRGKLAMRVSDIYEKVIGGNAMSTNDQVIGFALDVSGSMEASIQNISGGSESRLDSIRRALDTLLAEAERLSAAHIDKEPKSDLYFFAYAFGLRTTQKYGDMFRLLDCRELLSASSVDDIPTSYRDIVDQKTREIQAEYERRLQYNERRVAMEVMGDSARRLLYLSRAEAERELRRALTQHIQSQVVRAIMPEILKSDLTISLSELTNRWKSLRNGLSMSNDILGGNTPLRATLQEIVERFRRERTLHPNSSCTLFVVSDGDATDGDPRPAARLMAKAGVKIVSCFVSTQNVVEPRRLYSKSDDSWTKGARAMFDISSVLPVSGPESNYLTRIGWQAKAGDRMFAQINQSDLLSEFMNVVIAPIDAEHGSKN